MDKKVVPELIQVHYTTENTAGELRNILEGEGRKSMLNSYAALKIKVGGPGASERVAELIVERINNSPSTRG